jgi:hypothetical protein
MKVLQFIAAAFLAASIGAMTGAAFADLPQVYQSNSTGEVKGWEDASGYHTCHAGTDCRIPAEYDLIWVE